MKKRLDFASKVCQLIYMMMIERKTMKDKSRLAKLLAEEDIHVVHKKVETAAFDVKNRELVLPIWKDMSESVQDLFTLHEVGHAFWTPLDMLETARKKNIDFSFVNVLEDVRIEKMIQSRYPGGVRCFNLGYTELLQMDFFKLQGKHLKSMNLIDRINLHFKHVPDVPFSDAEMEWVQKANETKTPKQVLKLAQELYEYIEQNEESQGDPDQDGAGADGKMSQMPSEGNADAESQSGQSSDSSDGKEENQENGDSDDQSGAGDDQNTDQTEQGSNGSGDGDDEKSDKKGSEQVVTNGKEGGKSEGKKFVASTDSAYQQASKKFIDTNAQDRNYCWIPKLDNIKDMIDTPAQILEDLREFYKNDQNDTFFQYTQQELKTFLDGSKKTVSYITKEFEMKKAADQYNRATVAKTGSLDMSKLHTYKYNEDLFAKVTNVPGATNHGLVFFLDWSGSMQENMSGTMKQLFNLTEFCMRTKIPFDVFAFSDRAYRIKDRRFEQVFKSGDIKIDELKLFNFLSSSMSKKEQHEMMHYMYMMGENWKGYRNWSRQGYPLGVMNYYQLGGTPLNHAIIAAMKILPDFQKKHNVQKIHSVFLTDGYSHRVDSAYHVSTDKEGQSYNASKYIDGWRSADVHITDPISGAKIITDRNGRNGQTVSLFKLLKKRVPNMNIVGFFIAGSGKNGRVHKNIIEDKFGLHSYSDYAKVREIYKTLRKDNVVVSTEDGYDEFYILPGAGAMQESEELVVNPNAKVGELKRAFMKSSTNKMANRPVLNKFVGMIA